MTTSWHFAVSALSLLLALGTAAPAAAQDTGANEEPAGDPSTGDPSTGDPSTGDPAATDGANPYGGSTGDGDGDAAGPDDGAGAAGSSDAGGSTTGTTGTGTTGAGTTGSGTGTSGGTDTWSGTSGDEAAAGGNDTGTMPSGERRPPHHYGAEPPGVDDDDEDEEDEGDPYDFLWIELFGGASYVDLRAIEVDENYYPASVRLSGVGAAGGLAVGFRIEFLSIGVRGAYSYYPDDDGGFEVGTAVAEVKLHIPIPIVRPFLRVGFGMGWHGITDTDHAELNPPTTAETSAFGWAFNGAVGVDIYFAHWFSLGAAANIDILNMGRQAWDEWMEDPGSPGDVSFEQSGDAVGYQLRGQIAVTFHL